jgi:hypothetical protein
MSMAFATPFMPSVVWGMLLLSNISTHLAHSIPQL